MEFLPAFNKIMENTNDIALATSVNNTPNVRIVNYYYNPEKKGIVYFSSFKNNRKTMEFSQNNKVAFTTIPVGTMEFVRIVNAIVQKSNLTMKDVKDVFIKKYPGFEMILQQGEELLEVYEIHFNEAEVTLGFGKFGKVTL